MKKDEFDILKRYKVNSSRFPLLLHLPRDILAMLISTVASESAFSMGGRVLDPFRSSLLPKVVEALICTQNWLRSSKNPMSIEEDLDDHEKIEEAFSSIGLSEVAENVTET